jgi:hypothetical protein
MELFVICAQYHSWVALWIFLFFPHGSKAQWYFHIQCIVIPDNSLCKGYSLCQWFQNCILSIPVVSLAFSIIRAQNIFCRNYRYKNYLKSSVFWDITPCSVLKVSWHFGGTCCLHLWGWRISQERSLCENRWQAELTCLAYSLTLKVKATCSSEMSS